MPKYSLDARGILTITNESDGGIFSVAAWLKKLALVLAIISVLGLSILYFTNYTRFTDTEYLNGVFENGFSNMDISSKFSMMFSKINVSYPFVTVANNGKGQPGFFAEVFRTIAYKAEELFHTVRNTIQNIIS